MRGLLQSLAAEGRTVLVSSHLLAEMAQTAEELIIIGRGRLVANTSVAEFIRTNSGVTTVVRTPTEDAAAALAGALEREAVAFARAEDADGRWVIEVPDRTSDEVGRLAFAAGVALSELSERRASLEEAYMRSTEGHAQYVSSGGTNA